MSLTKSTSKRSKTTPRKPLTSTHSSRHPHVQSSISKSPILTKPFLSSKQSRENFPLKLKKLTSNQLNQTFNTTLNHTKLIQYTNRQPKLTLQSIHEQITYSSSKLIELQQKIKKQESNLSLLILKSQSFESIYLNKKNEISQSRRQIEEMSKRVEEKYRKIEKEKENNQKKWKECVQKIEKCEKFKEEILKKQSQIKKEKEQIQSTLIEVQKWANELKQKEEGIENIRVQQFAKEIQLKSRQSQLGGYYKQMNQCIRQLKQERGNFGTIADELGQKCELLQGIQVKIWMHLMQNIKTLVREQGNQKEKVSSKKWITIDTVGESDWFNKK